MRLFTFTGTVAIWSGRSNKEYQRMALYKYQSVVRSIPFGQSVAPDDNNTTHERIVELVGKEALKTTFIVCLIDCLFVCVIVQVCVCVYSIREY